MDVLLFARQNPFLAFVAAVLAVCAAAYVRDTLLPDWRLKRKAPTMDQHKKRAYERLQSRYGTETPQRGSDEKPASSNGSGSEAAGESKGKFKPGKLSSSHKPRVHGMDDIKKRPKFSSGPRGMKGG